MLVIICETDYNILLRTQKNKNILIAMNLGTLNHNLKPFDITIVVWKVPEVMSTVLSKE